MSRVRYNYRFLGFSVPHVWLISKKCYSPHVGKAVPYKYEMVMGWLVLNLLAALSFSAIYIYILNCCIS